MVFNSWVVKVLHKEQANCTKMHDDCCVSGYTLTFVCLLHAENVDDIAFLGGYASFECRNIGSTGNEYDTITRFVLLFLVLLQM